MSTIEQHFCVTTYIFNLEGTKTALIKHKKLGWYLGAGGHIDENEDYFEAATRELREEMGIEATYPTYINKVEFGCVQPFSVQKNQINENHYHVDLIFGGVVDEGTLFKPASGESTDIQWFEVEKIENCNTTEEARKQIRNMSALIVKNNKLEAINKDIYRYPKYKDSLKEDLATFVEGHDFNTWNLGGIYEEVPMNYASKMGAKYGIFCSTGTAGMHAGLMALGLLPGDEVIVPSMTFIRATTPLTHLQLQPVIADIDPFTGNISPESIRKVITPKTKAVVVVHMWGVPADCEAIRQICDEHGLKMIEDFSHAHYSKYKDKFVGSFGDVSFCSLQRKKTLSVGEGGLIVTSNPQVFERLKHITSPGSFVDQSNYSNVDFSGYGLNMRMSPFSAVTARNIYSDIDEIIKNRRDNLKIVTDIISQNTDKIELPKLPEYTSFDDISWYSYKVKLNGVSLSDLKQLKFWKFGDLGYSPIAGHNYWNKDKNFFPFNFGIKPILNTTLEGHDKYMDSRVSLNTPTVDASYWTEQMIQAWTDEIKKIN